MRHLAAAAFLLSCLAMPATASAQVTIYRCTDAAGGLTVQNKPCPAGSSQSERQVADLASSPAAATPPPGATAPPSVPPSGSSDQSLDAQHASGGGAAPLQYAADGSAITTSTGPEPRILDSANLPRTTQPTAGPDPGAPPPPPIFRCTTYDNDSYLSEDAEVPPRCLALRTVGLDGNPAGGAGRACEVVRDQCARVPDGAACEAWARHAREAESRWRFAHPDNVERRRAEYERLAKLVGESCGASP